MQIATTRRLVHGTFVYSGYAELYQGHHFPGSYTEKEFPCHFNSRVLCSSERQNSAFGILITSRTSRLCLSVCLSNHHVSKERSTGMHISCLVECLLSNSAYISDLDFLFIYGLFNHALSGYDYCCDYFRVSVHGALCQLIHIHSRLGTQLCTVTAFRFLPRHSPGMKKKMKNLLITLPEIRKGPVSP